MSPKALLSRAISMVLVIASMASMSSGKEIPKTLSKEVIDRSVVAFLSKQGAKKPGVIIHLDLTGSFLTASQWTLVVVQDEAQQESEPMEEKGRIFVCLMKAARPDCSFEHNRQTGNGMSEIDVPYHFQEGRVVYKTQGKSDPLLLVNVCGAKMFDGNCGNATALFRYDEKSDQFSTVFLQETGRNNNEDMRFVENGPLQGDMIVNYPTGNAPFVYWVEVFRAGETGQYTQILRYRSHTRYGDNNPLAVADSEMPEILQRFGFWKPGDPLPVPPHMSPRCKTYFMQRGEEWCK